MDSFDYDRRWHSRQEEESDAFQWFHDFYYDPIAEAAAGITRRYRWLPQDAISPYEVLHQQFSRKLSSETIRDVSNELSQQSSNWRARPDEFADGAATPPRRDNLPVRSEEAISRAELLNTIAELEAAIGAIRSPAPSFGHNMPPEGINDDPATKAELDALVAVVADMKAQATSPKPDQASIAGAQTKLLSFSQTVMSWSGARGTKFVDAVLDSGGKALGTAVILQLTGILPQVYAVVSAAGRLLAALAG